MTSRNFYDERMTTPFDISRIIGEWCSNVPDRTRPDIDLNAQVSQKRRESLTGKKKKEFLTGLVILEVVLLLILAKIVLVYSGVTVVMVVGLML